VPCKSSTRPDGRGHCIWYADKRHAGQSGDLCNRRAQAFRVPLGTPSTLAIGMPSYEASTLAIGLTCYSSVKKKEEREGGRSPPSRTSWRPTRQLRSGSRRQPRRPGRRTPEEHHAFRRRFPSYEPNRYIQPIGASQGAGRRRCA